MKIRILIVTCLAISISSIVIFYLADHPFRALLFNADALYLPTLFADLFSKGGHVSDWYLTPAPYFFPDWIIYGLAHYLGSDAYRSIVLFAVIQILFTFGAVWLLCRTTCRTKGIEAATTVTIILLWLASNNIRQFVYLLISAHHFGAFASAVLFVALCSRFINCEKPKSFVLMTAICAIAFLSTLSDSLFAVQTVVPFVFATAVVFGLRKELALSQKLILSLPVAFTGLGWVSYKLLVTNRTRYPVSIDPAKVIPNLKSIFSIYYDVVLSSPVYTAVVALYLMLVLYTAHSLIQSKKMNARLTQLVWLVLISFGSLVFTIAVQAILSYDVTDRYYIATFCWPIIVVILSLNHFFERGFSALCAILSVALSVALAFNAWQQINQSRISDHFYPSDIACIDEALSGSDVSKGIASYWDAKYLQAFSQRELVIAQYSGQLEEFRWITSKKFFSDHYDFAIISRDASPDYVLSSEKLIQINGKPERIASCGNKIIFIYRAGQLSVN